MRAAKKGSSPLVLFFLSALFFIFCLSFGMIAAYHLDGEILKTLSEYVKAALEEKISFKKVFLNAVKSDFRYTVFVLISSLSVISSVFPLIFIGFKGFSSGLAVAVASKVLLGFSDIFAFSLAVFLSCVFTVPVYVLMFIMCFKFASGNQKSQETFGGKLRDYMEFFIAVMLPFAALCIFDCFEAVLSQLLFVVIK